MLGQLYVRQHRIEEAKARFQDVLKRDPKSVPADTMLAMLLEGQGRTAEAEKEYQHILALDGQAAVAANNLAWIYVAGDRNLDEALQLAQTAHQALILLYILLAVLILPILLGRSNTCRPYGGPSPCRD